VDIVTKAALKEMAVPAIMAVLAPLVVGFILLLLDQDLLG
jgi:Na+/H+-translocating membrane pyrophosphatase